MELNGPIYQSVIGSQKYNGAIDYGLQFVNDPIAVRGTSHLAISLPTTSTANAVIIYVLLSLSLLEQLYSSHVFDE